MTKINAIILGLPTSLCSSLQPILEVYHGTCRLQSKLQAALSKHIRDSQAEDSEAEVLWKFCR